VHEHIKASEVVDYALDTLTASRRVSDVGFECAYRPAVFRDGRAEICRHGHGPSGNDGDVCALPCKCERSGGPNTAGTTGDETDFFLQIHVSLF
jgi:hypothetical protein